MDELREHLRATLSEDMDEIFLQNNERPGGGTTSDATFDLSAAFTVDFQSELVGLFNENEDTGDEGEKNTTAEEVCRVCLCTDKPLYSVSAQNQVAYQCVLGTDESKSNDLDLPQKVCWDCNARMTSFTTFRTKAVQTNTLLYSLIRPFMSATEQSTIGRIQRAEMVGLIGNSRCFIHRQGRSQPYNLLTDETIPVRPHRLSFCVLQRPARITEFNHMQVPQPRDPE